MSEDRTQPPSKRRLQQARERGQVARSPDLTAAVGLLAAATLLGVWGGDLASAMVAIVRAPLEADPAVAADPAEVVAMIRRSALAVGLPLGAILGGVLAAMVAAHQVQVGGLWAPGLLAPDPTRLWAGWGADPFARFGRGVWSLAKTLVVVAVAAWSIRANLPAFQRLGGLDGPGLARASGALLRGLAYSLALAMLVLGLADFALQYRRLMDRLRLTPEEHREDQKAVDGDPAIRARRFRIARAWRLDPAEVLAGAVVVLTGPAGLTIVLAGGPPPGPVRVRSIARGADGTKLRRAAGRAQLDPIDSPTLARHFVRGRLAGPLPPDLATELAALWPGRAAPVG